MTKGNGAIATRGDELLAAALKYAGRGWHVFPVGPDKKPLAGSHGWKDASCEAEIIAEMPWGHAASVAIATGPSKLLVLDVDPPDGEKALRDLIQKNSPLPSTFRVKTPRCGTHHFFTVQEDIPSSASRVAPNLDIRAQGGYVVAASPGNAYQVEVDTPPAPAPAWLVAAALTQKKQYNLKLLPTTKAAPSLANKIRRASAYLAKIPGAVTGNGGHDTTWGAALAVVRGFDLPEDVALSLLETEYNPRCSPPWSEKEIRHKVQDAAKATVAAGYLLEDRRPRSGRLSDPVSPAETLAPKNGNVWLKPEIFTAAELDVMDIPAQRWAVPGILAAGLGILAGRPKIGKSWFALDLAVCVATGRKFLGQYAVDQGEVLCLMLEDTKRRLQDRLRKIYGSSKAPDALNLSREWPRLGKGAIEEMRDWLEKHPAARLIIIDTLGRLRGRRGKNEDQYSEDYAAMESLKAEADARGAALLTLHHQRKAACEDPVDSISGTLGIAGGVDTLLILQRTRGQMDAELVVTGRDIEDNEIALVFDKDNCRWSAVGFSEEFLMSDERKQIIAVLSRSVEGFAPKAIAEATGMPVDNVKRLLAKMIEDGQVKSLGYGSYVLPENAQERLL